MNFAMSPCIAIRSASTASRSPAASRQLPPVLDGNGRTYSIPTRGNDRGDSPKLNGARSPRPNGRMKDVRANPHGLWRCAVSRRTRAVLLPRDEDHAPTVHPAARGNAAPSRKSDQPLQKTEAGASLLGMLGPDAHKGEDCSFLMALLVAAPSADRQPKSKTTPPGSAQADHFAQGIACFLFVRSGSWEKILPEPRSSTPHNLDVRR